MRADLGTLLEKAHRDIPSLYVGELLQADRGGEAGGTDPDDHVVVLHHFAGHADVPFRAGGHATGNRSL